jgi:hypothetical protein
MPDHDGLLAQPADHLGVVVGDLPDGLVREDLGMGVRLGDRLGIVGPAGRERRVAGLLEDGGPAVPAARQQPEAVDEHDGRLAGSVRALDFLGLGDGRGAGHVPPGDIARPATWQSRGASSVIMPEAAADDSRRSAASSLR